MFKFLRKYNKFILAVGGSLLVIVFLIPQAIQQLSQQAALRSTEVATVGATEEDVSYTEWQNVLAESQIVQRLTSTGVLNIPGVPEIQDAGHWYLLTREAEQLGFMPPRPTPPFTISEADVLSLQQSGESVALYQRTMAKVQGVVQMLRTFIQAGDMSDRRLQKFAERLFHAVGLQTVVISADAEKATLTPSEQQLQEQLETYKDVLPGEGKHGFGYKLPNRVKLAWVTVTADSVRAAIEASNKIDGRALRRHWNENAGQRGLPPIPDELAAVPDVVREDLLDQLVSDELDQIEKFAYDQIRVPQRNLSKRDGFYELPDDWATRQIDLQELAKQIRQRFNISPPQYTAPGSDWVAVDELPSMEGIGAARTEKFGRLASTLSGIVARAREFDGNGTIPIQQGVAGPPLRGTDGSVYIFRISATDPSRPPTSVDEVRDQLVSDLRRSVHYEQLVTQTQQMQEIAQNEGLLALALQYDSEIAADNRAALYDPDKYFIDSIRGQGLDALPSQVPGLGDAPKVLEAIIDWARTFPVDAKMKSIPAAERIRVFDAEDQFAVVVVLLTKQYPLTVEDYKKLTADSQLEALLMGEELGDVTVIQEVFGYDALAARHNFTPSQPANQTDQTTQPDDDAGEGADTEA